MSLYAPDSHASGQGLAIRSVNELFEDNGTIAYAVQGSGRDCHVVADDIELGKLRLLREVWLIRVRYTDLTPVDSEHLDRFVLCHFPQTTTAVPCYGDCETRGTAS